MTDWFRSWHGAPTDPKWLGIGRRVGIAPGIVAAVAWALMDRASQAEDRGSIEGYDADGLACFFGCDPEQVDAIVEAMTDKGILAGGRFTNWEKRQPKREDGSAERAREWRGRKAEKTNATPDARTHPNARERTRTLETDTETDTEKGEANASPKRERAKAQTDDLSDFKAECADLDAERLEALVKHRRAKRGQLTGHAAKLFRRDAGACGLSLAEAVDMCISRNWVTVRPEYLQDRHAPRAASPPPRDSMADYAGALLRKLETSNEPPYRNGPTIDAGDGRGSGSLPQISLAWPAAQGRR